MVSIPSFVQTVKWMPGMTQTYRYFAARLSPKQRPVSEKQVAPRKKIATFFGAQFCPVKGMQGQKTARNRQSCERDTMTLLTHGGVIDKTWFPPYAKHITTKPQRNTRLLLCVFTIKNIWCASKRWTICGTYPEQSPKRRVFHD